jgi:DNA-binding CsgD family transcriptional regulator
MEHFQIWIQIITLIVGTAVLFDTIQFHKRYRYRFLKPLWYCFLFLNLDFLMGVISRYLFINFFDDLRLFKSSLFLEIADPFATVFLVALVYFLISLKRSLQDKSTTKSMQWLFISAVIFIIIRAFIGLFYRHPAIIFQAVNFIHLVILFCAFVLFVVVMGRFVFASNRVKDKEMTGPIKQFGIFYLSGFVLIILSSIFSGPYHRIVYVLVCLSFNIFPFFWLRLSLPGNKNSLAFVANETDLAEICEKFGVSSRQMEIIRLILSGKSNKDIADVLFIAPHTVKNHIYNLYQKLGIKSRFELVNLFLKNAQK